MRNEIVKKLMYLAEFAELNRVDKADRALGAPSCYKEHKMGHLICKYGKQVFIAIVIKGVNTIQIGIQIVKKLEYK